MSSWIGSVFRGILPLFMVLAGDLLYGQAGMVLSWEEASLRAIQENRLVLAAVGVLPDRRITGCEAVQFLLNRQVVPVYIDPESDPGKAFLPKLLLYPCPTYAFFMPFGDLLTVADPGEVSADPLLLADAGKRAAELAVLKKRNSRSVVFAGEWELAQEQAVQEDKPIFVYLRDGRVQASLLVENNVLNLDTVADFYNSRFVCFRVDVGQERQWGKKYGITALPAFLFLTADGKKLGGSSGWKDAAAMIDLGKEALKKSVGLAFDTLPPDLSFDRLFRGERPVFLRLSAPAGAGDSAAVFKDPEVAERFAARFTNLIQGAESEAGKRVANRIGVSAGPVYAFFAPSGEFLHAVKPPVTASALIGEAELALTGRGVAAVREHYRQGRTDAAGTERYIALLERAGMEQEAGTAVENLLAGLEDTCLWEERYWKLYRKYVRDAFSPRFAWIGAHREELSERYGKQETEQYIREVWSSGAGSFLTETAERSRFDEKGFQTFVRRMRKEEVEDWQGIARIARMQAAEKTGDWQRYAEMAEERWMTEKISDEELYRWGSTIRDHCDNPSIRYKAAHWIALAVIEIEQKEKRGKTVRISSYKGFLEKLVNDLTASP